MAHLLFSRGCILRTRSRGSAISCYLFCCQGSYHNNFKQLCFKNQLKYLCHFTGTMSSKEEKKHVDLTGMRVPYLPEDVEKTFTSKDPIELFSEWFTNAKSTDTIKEANAMALATADKSGKPSVRYVLLKGYSKDGFTFFSNYNSRKGQEIAENPKGALLFYWESLCHQIRIEGTIAKIPEEESEDYFQARPKSSQLSAVVSRQSEVIEGREFLLKKKKDLEQQYESASIPRPKHWGGYLLTPETFEFWCGRSDRLHDRIRFRRKDLSEVPDEKITHSGENGWVYEYLSP